MIIYPIVVSALAVLVTLIYASYLDIKDRRVPFRTWYPMLVVGISATIVVFYQHQQTGNISLIAGYLALVTSFLYADYLDNHEPGTLFRIPYLGIVLALPALSWFIIPAISTGKIPDTQLIPWYAMFVGLLGYVSYREYKRQPERKLKAKQAKKESRRDSNVEEVLSRWYFILVVIILVIASFYMIGDGSWDNSGIYIAFAAVFCGVFYMFGQMRLFGGADAWALIFIAFCVPTFPFAPLLNTPPLGFLSFSVLINALILNLVAPLGIFIINVIKKNRAAPLQYMFFGFPVDGENIQDSWGFIMEDFVEKDSKVERKFIGFWDSLRRMRSDEGRVYTKDIREHPEEFEKELGIYKKAGKVWISYAVPFILPITAGFISAILFGDFLFSIIKIIGVGA
jgi:preflagellin peptidase FlaK